jgi:hypothetical protein
VIRAKAVLGIVVRKISATSGNENNGVRFPKMDTFSKMGAFDTGQHLLGSLLLLIL